MEGVRSKIQLAELKRRAARLTPGLEDELRALAESWLANPIHDIFVRFADKTIIDGHRRVEGLVLLGVKEAEVVLVEGDLGDDKLDDIAFETAWHRAPLNGIEQATLLRSRKERSGLSNKDLAASVHIDSSMVTRLVSLFTCIPEVQEAAHAGNLGVTDWYSMSQNSPEVQREQLRMRLNGATRDEIAEKGKQSRNGKSANGKGESSNTKFSSIRLTTSDGVTVVFKGKEMSLDDAVKAALDVKSQIEAAKSAKHTTKTLKTWVANGGKDKPKKKSKGAEVTADTSPLNGHAEPTS